MRITRDIKFWNVILMRVAMAKVSVFPASMVCTSWLYFTKMRPFGVN